MIRAISDLELAAVCDVVEEKAKRAAHGTTAAAYGDFEAMLGRENLDIVSILTESGSHARIGSVAALHARTVVIEKPMALTLDDADRLIEACDLNRTRLFVVKQNRYNRPVVFLRRALDTGRFGKLVMGTVRVRWCRRQDYYDLDRWRGTWKDDGGVLTNQASHHMDLLQWMMGPVESVKAYTATRLVAIETEDTAVAILRFTSGALGVVEATTATRPKDLEGSISILGEKGSVVIGGFAVNKLETWNFDSSVPGDSEIDRASTHPPDVYGLGHYEFYKDVIDCIRTGRRAMLDGLEGRKSLELINAIYESASSGNEIRLRYVPRGVQLGR